MNALRIQKRESHPLDIAIQAVVSHHPGVLGTEFQSSGKSVAIFNRGVISLGHVEYFFINVLGFESSHIMLGF